MLLLGLTGNIACGKSSVSRMLEARGARALDADLLVRELYADTEFAARIADLFPTQQVRTREKTVDRAALAELVFGNTYAMRRLEAVVHPAVAALRDAKLQALRELQTPPPAVVLEAVKLIESGQADACDLVWCLLCAPEVQLRRLMEARGLSEEEARARLASQPPMEVKIERLRRVGVPLVMVENNGTIEELEANVEREWQRAQELRAL